MSDPMTSRIGFSLICIFYNEIRVGITATAEKKSSSAIDWEEFESANRKADWDSASISTPNSVDHKFEISELVPAVECKCLENLVHMDSALATLL